MLFSQPTVQRMQMYVINEMAASQTTLSLCCDNREGKLHVCIQAILGE